MPADPPRNPPEARAKLAEPGIELALDTLPNLRTAGAIESRPPSPCLPVQVGTFKGAAYKEAGDIGGMQGVQI